MKKIVVITTGWFPEGDAGAVRLFMMGKALVRAGYGVTVLSRGNLNENKDYDGIRHISLRKRTGKIGKAFDYFTFPEKVKKYLNKNKSNINGVYIYHGVHLRLLSFCKSFCKKNGIKLYYDCVEWFSPEEYKQGERSPAYRVNNKINTRIIDNLFSVIAISRYLEEHFRSRGIDTIRVPILCDCEQRAYPKSDNGEKLTLFYAGSPARKDLVGNVLDAVALLDADERKKLRIMLVGATKEYLISMSGISSETIDACSDVLELCGRVPRDEVLRRMEEADFVLLPRDAELRYAKAGFPSKVVEALANATPIFCNLSSDLGEFLVDGENAIISDSHMPEDIATALKRAIELTPTQKNDMSRNALETAKNNFDYRLYSEELDEFFGNNR